jgi:hypothetical protein
VCIYSPSLAIHLVVITNLQRSGREYSGVSNAPTEEFCKSSSTLEFA